MATFLVTGANRGIGLAITRQLAKRGDRVFAGTRQPARADALRDLEEMSEGRIRLLPLDVNDVDSIHAAARTIEEVHGQLDTLINNAGIYLKGAEANKLGSLMAGPILEALRINAVAPLLVAQAMTPLLEKSDHPRIVNVSSQMGSIEGKTSGGSYSYCISKAALNMAMRAFANDAKAKNIISIVIHPGWVKTDMGGANADLDPEEAARGILMVTDGLTMSESGGFFDWRGRTMAW